MKVKQYQVQVIPRDGGIPFHVVVGGRTKSDAWRTAENLYPNASCVVMKEI
jgi:hypothetical protein